MAEYQSKKGYFRDDKEGLKAILAEPDDDALVAQVHRQPGAPRTRYTYRMRFIDDEDVIIVQIREHRVQVSAIAIHAEERLGDDKRRRRTRGLRRQPSMLVDLPLQFRRSQPIDERGMVAFIGVSGARSCSQGRDRADGGKITRGKEQRPLALQISGEVLLQEPMFSMSAA